MFRKAQAAPGGDAGVDALVHDQRIVSTQLEVAL
jgi:hypothetical protein